MSSVGASRPGRLAHLSVDQIQRNPENPRIFFRAGELEALQQSIQKYGIQVPISVFKRGKDYFLIDGERRWRCASKLNLATIPALIQEDPGQLDNLLLMYNIHALREQWDTMTVALKLPTITKLLEERLGRRPTEPDLAEATGQSRGMIRKCRLLTALPEKHKNVLLVELKKPKSKQELGEEFYLVPRPGRSDHKVLAAGRPIRWAFTVRTPTASFATTESLPCGQSTSALTGG